MGRYSLGKKKIMISKKLAYSILSLINFEYK